ncbi:Aflatoxin biosynthesis regulatory protein [Penicillium sp. DV-2018c]|nr:Aflatoxin biosynthesis regulatory protein [Penicillium sp. DV-2018c]
MSMVQAKLPTRHPNPARPMQGQTKVFRVPNYKSKNTTPHRSGEPSERIYHPRRSHRKSRVGCANCKQRRIKAAKCDETKPCCLRCQKHGVDCDYSGQAVVHAPKTTNIVADFIEIHPELISIDSLASSMSLMMVVDKLNELLLPVSPTRPQLPRKPRKPRDPSASMRTIEALHHFHQGPPFPSEPQSNVRRVMDKMVRLAFETPFLMHAIIAASTTHLCAHLPNNKSYRLAEAYHWQNAITQYSTEISHITYDNTDKLYTACMLISMHSFHQETFNPTTSFVFTIATDSTALTWLRIQSGLRYLLARTAPWLPQSTWWSVFSESRGADADFEDSRPGRVDLHPDLADLCGITEDSTVQSNPYLWPLRMLMRLLVLERCPGSFGAYSTWMGRLENEFYVSLERREVPALVLLAWWLGLMCFVDEWWVEIRVRSECTAICMFLEGCGDPGVLKLLVFPAECCGYELKYGRGWGRVLELE